MAGIAVGIPSIVRVSKSDPKLILHALDAGHKRSSCADGKDC